MTEPSAQPLNERARQYVAIALCSAAVILLQIAVTRILSVIVWYHWAFFSISLAMLGVGAPGVWFALQRPHSPERVLQRVSLAAAILMPASIVAIVKASHLFGASTILFCLGCLLPPVLCLGAVVCLLLLETDGPAISRMYAFDLLGAFVGALLIIPLMWLIPTPALAASLALLPLVAYRLLGGRAIAAAGVLLALVAMWVWGEPFVLRHGKSYAETSGRTVPIYERWTPTARITVFDSIFFMDRRMAFGWGFGTRAPLQAPAEQYWMEQDGSAGSPITRFVGNTERLQYLLFDVTSLGYQLRPPRTAAVIGPGGGRDVLTALMANTHEVTAIELNPAIVEALRTRFATFSGHLYDHPRVHTIIGEGRSTLTRTSQQFDLIQISLIDSWAATAAGAYSLSENNLYTVEAYRRYFSRLTPHGLVSTSRWMKVGFDLDIPRLLFVVRDALHSEGVSDPLQHLVVVQGSAVGNVMMLRSPLTQDELDRLRDIAAQRGFIVHLPEHGLPLAQRWLRGVYDGGPHIFDPWGLRMQPSVDDRPFYFQNFSPLRKIRRDVAAAHGVNAEGVLSLQRLMLAMTAVTLVLFFAPFLLGRWLRPTPSFWRGSVYFAAIGLAFILVEVAWLQRFILYLGHPSLATTVALGCILLGAGLGSISSARLGLLRAQRYGFVLALYLLAVNAALKSVFELSLGWAWSWRLLVSVGLLVPAGFLMGFCFPLGMIRFGDQNKAWFWALNGAAGVLASVLSLALSMELGFSRVAAIGAGLYFTVWLLGRGNPLVGEGGDGTRAFRP